MFRRWLKLLSGLLLMAPVVPGLGVSDVQAQNLCDTLTIAFPADSVRVSMAYDGNDSRWSTFNDRYAIDYGSLSAADVRIDIYTGGSPEDAPAHNLWLGETRGQTLRRLLRRHFGQGVGTIEVHNEGSRWDRLYDMVAAGHEPWRDDVLDIIEQQPSAEENKPDRRVTLLRQLQGGTVWADLQQRYMAPLRSNAIVVISGNDPNAIAAIAAAAVIAQPKHPGDPQKAAAKAEKKARRDSILSEQLQYPAWAVKTNLLLWGVVAPNIELELPIGRNNRWSMELEYFTPWFTWSHNAHASQFQNLGLELRLWLGNRKHHRWLQGWHIGVAGAVGYYDWEWKRSEGYQGEHLNTYLNLGYQHRFGRHWALDASIGAGYLVTKYRHYYGGSVYPEEHLEPWDEHLIYHDSGRFHWIGPCHASLSIVYLFNAWPFHVKDRKLKKYRDNNDLKNNRLNGLNERNR